MGGAGETHWTFAIQNGYDIHTGSSDLQRVLERGKKT